MPVSQQEIARFKNNVCEDYIAEDNAKGNLAWKESWQSMALVEMYEATEDTFFLDKLVEHADRVWQHRDDKHGKVDAVRNKVMPGWGSTDFSQGEWHVWLVHTGIITYPIASFVRIVCERSELHEQYKATAHEYSAYITEAIDGFEDEWVESGEDGYYRFPDGLLSITQPDYKSTLSPHPLPINQYLSLGDSLLELVRAAQSGGTDYEKIFDAKKYLERSRRMAHFSKKQLRVGARPATCVWDYGFGNAASVDDVSHGAGIVMFAILAERHGLVFTKDDLKAFANTFHDIIVKKDGRLSFCVDGSGESSDDMDSIAGLWLDLTAVDARVYDRCHELIVRRGKDIQQLGYSKILKWKRRNCFRCVEAQPVLFANIVAARATLRI